MKSVLNYITYTFVQFRLQVILDLFLLSMTVFEDHGQKAPGHTQIRVRAREGRSAYVDCLRTDHEFPDNVAQCHEISGMSNIWPTRRCAGRLPKLD